MKSPRISLAHILRFVPVAVVLLFATTAHAQDSTPPVIGVNLLPLLPFPTDLGQFIIWLAGNGSSSVLIPILIERWTWFRLWKSPWKGRLVMIAYVALFPAFGQLALWAWGAVDPVLRGYVVTGLAWAFIGLAQWYASQRVHAADKAELGPAETHAPKRDE
jgi:hypothetical protein